MSKIPKKPRTSRKAIAGAFGGAFGAGTVQASGVSAALAELLTWVFFVHGLGLTPGEEMEIDIREQYNNLQSILDFLFMLGGGALTGWLSGHYKKESRSAINRMETVD